MRGECVVLVHRGGYEHMVLGCGSYKRSMSLLDTNSAVATDLSDCGVLLVFQGVVLSKDTHLLPTVHCTWGENTVYVRVCVCARKSN